MGKLIALEGIDGSGKSTQARRLGAALRARGIDAVVFREPGDSQAGDKLREQFRHGRTITPQQEADLFIADRRIDVRDNIVPALAAGRVVVMDRYYFSTMAYQGALGLDVEELRRENESFAPRPHLTLILDVPPETSAHRIVAARVRPSSYEDVDYLAKVRKLFLSFCSGDIIALDATTPEDDLAAEILTEVYAVLDRE
jgi:dTMP kinase